MVIHRLIASGTFDLDEVKAMVAAYESALTDLHLIDRNDPLTEIIARSIVDMAATGGRDPESLDCESLKERALNGLGIPIQISNIFCPRCRTRMRLFGIEPEAPGYELHSFECPECQNIDTAVAKIP